MFFCLSSHILGAKIHLAKVGGIPFRQQRRVKALLGGDRDISCHALPTSFAGAGDVVVGAQEDASVRRSRRCSCRGTGGRLSRRGQRDHHDSAYFFSLLQRSGGLDSTQLRASVSGEQKSARQHSTFSLLVKV